jgi:hypothetical protein
VEIPQIRKIRYPPRLARATGSGAKRSLMPNSISA